MVPLVILVQNNWIHGNDILKLCRYRSRLKPSVVMGSPPLKLSNGKDKASGYIRGEPERGLRFGSFLSDGGVLQERGSMMLLDPGFRFLPFGRFIFMGA